MSIIKVISDDGVNKIFTLGYGEVSIDMQNCKNIVFYNFLRNNIKFISEDNEMLLSLPNGTTAYLKNMDIRFSKYKSIKLDFCETYSNDISFLVGTKVLLKYCLSKSFSDEHTETKAAHFLMFSGATPKLEPFQV